VELTDAQLVGRVRAGDTTAFGDLVRRHQGAVYGIAWHGVRSFDDAQDVAQEALVKAFRTLSQLADPNRFGAWLHAITRNECRMWRRSRRDLAPIQGDAVLAQTARDEWARHEARSEVIRAVASLPDDSRLVVSLRYLSGLSCDEISATLGVPLTTVEGRLSRARRKLREEMMAMAQETLAENKLPEEFADRVLRELSLTPGGWVNVMDIGPDLRTIVLGDPQGGADAALVALALHTSDSAAILSGPFEIREAQPKSRGIECALQIIDAFGIGAERVVLYLHNETQCRARVHLRRGRSQRTVDMRASDGLALAARLKAPILAEEAVIRQGKVGEDGLGCSPDLDLAAFAANLQVLHARTILEQRAFDIGLAPEEGRDVVRYWRDDPAGSLRIEVPGSDRVPLVLDLAENRAAIDRLWFEASMPEDDHATWRNGREYRTVYTGHDHVLEVRYEPVAQEPLA